MNASNQQLADAKSQNALTKKNADEAATHTFESATSIAGVDHSLASFGATSTYLTAIVGIETTYGNSADNASDTYVTTESNAWRKYVKTSNALDTSYFSALEQLKSNPNFDAATYVQQAANSTSNGGNGVDVQPFGGGSMPNQATGKIPPSEKPNQNHKNQPAYNINFEVDFPEKRRVATEEDLREAYETMKAALEAIKSGGLEVEQYFDKWYGNHDEKTKGKVQDILKNIIGGMEANDPTKNTALVLVYSPEESDRAAYITVYPTPLSRIEFAKNGIVLTEVFFKAIQSERAGLLIHELSHYYGGGFGRLNTRRPGTQDYGYWYPGTDGSRYYFPDKNRNPVEKHLTAKQLLSNAGTFQYFIMSIKKITVTEESSIKIPPPLKF